MSSNGSNDKNDRPGGEGLAGTASVEEETSRKRPFKSLAQDVSYTYSRGNNNIMGRSGFCDGEQVNESIPEGLESMVRRMVSTATQDMQNRMDTIQNENKELKDKCNELEIKVKDLTLKDEYNEWSYTAEDIPASYWISRGFSEDYAERMVAFLGKMKEYTHRLRRGEPQKTIMLNFVNDNKMLHDDILLPHWKELIDALVQYQKFDHCKDYGIHGLFIRNVQLQQEVLDMLAPGLRSLHTKYFGLGGNIGSDLVTFMSDIIQINPHLEQVGWRDQIQSVDNMRQLCNSVKNKASTSLDLLGLKSAFDGNNSELIQIILDASRQLETLILSNNGIGSVGATFIANWLASNPPLKHLNLIGNDLNDTDASLLGNVLKSNISLERIDLDDNNDITTVGRKALLESVFNVSSLNACAASNHTCQIHGLNPDISGVNTYISSTNRSMKVFTLLSATDDDDFFNMNCLGDASYKLIPEVLGLAQEFNGETPELYDVYFEQTGQRSADWSQLDGDTLPITSMFERLRGWAVPSLS